MKQYRLFFSLILIIIASAAFIVLQNKNNSTQKLTGEEIITQGKTCLASYAIDSQGALFLQFDEALTDKKLNRAEADSFKPPYKGAFKALATAEDYRINGEAIAWADNAGKRIVINNLYFDDLQFRDATTLRPEPLDIGKVKPTLLSIWPSRTLTSFLLETQMIDTYWHIGATVCLAEEQETSEMYTARFKASHEYFTNERNVENYNFAIRVYKKTGLIQIFGE